MGVPVGAGEVLSQQALDHALSNLQEAQPWIEAACILNREVHGNGNGYAEFPEHR